MKRCGISRYLAYLLFFFPLAAFSKEGAIKLAEGLTPPPGALTVAEVRTGARYFWYPHSNHGSGAQAGLRIQEIAT